MTDAQQAAIKAAEDQIQTLLNELTIEIGGDIENVRVDTRLFGQLSVEIHTSVDD